MTSNYSVYDLAQLWGGCTDRIAELEEMSDTALISYLDSLVNWDAQALAVLTWRAGLDPDDYDDFDSLLDACDEALPA